MLGKAIQAAKNMAHGVFDSSEAHGAIESFAASERGQTGASRGVNIVVGIVVSALVAAYLIPVAIDEIVGVDTSSWTSGSQSLWDILPLIIVLAVFLFMIGLALSRSNL